MQALCTTIRENLKNKNKTTNHFFSLSFMFNFKINWFPRSSRISKNPIFSAAPSPSHGPTAGSGMVYRAGGKTCEADVPPCQPRHALGASASTKASTKHKKTKIKNECIVFDNFSCVQYTNVRALQSNPLPRPLQWEGV